MNNKLAKLFLRIGLAFVFVYASVEIYIHPENFLKYVPQFMLDLVPMQLFLDVFGVVEVALALWILSGWKGQYSAMIAVLLIAGITFANTEYFYILFRNVAIACGGMALIFLEANLLEANLQKDKDFGFHKKYS